MINDNVLSSIIGNQKLTELISEKEIKKRISGIAENISKRYKGKIPIIIGVLYGSFLFLADIVRELDIEYEVDFIKISSYGNSTTTSGTVRLLKDISADITGRDIILIEDIVDTGLSLNFLKKRFEDAAPNSLAFVTLLHKPHTSKIDFIIDQDLPYLESNILKYVCRHRFKNGVEDLKKAKFYLQRLIDMIQ